MADEDDPVTSTSRTPLFADREGGPPDAPDPRDQEEDDDDGGLPHDRRRGRGGGGPKWRWWWKTARGRGRALLASREKHFAIMAMVSLDVVALLVDILVSLVACDWGRQDEPWVGETQEATKICGLVFSCLFLAELAVSVWAFGVS
ncbi:uncharacterized protein E0L32_007108 [Thyridium curvatum]|uniref:Hydrogen voltage-gated channel 1 n=1 Tax=Thyridium curvatum TaxID=1093900 RepID=A0A507AQG2_9PEZI|nr:uncharacterized protein E0L32_007108 [Thyridium curvatum]TPX12222.1 hypothetical protein E0L32_007108 [Thyridium curvatum]